MNGKSYMRAVRLKPLDRGLLRSILLAVFFLVGGIFGHVFAEGLSDSVHTDIEKYLTELCTVCDSGEIGISLERSVFLYFGGTVLSFLLGFASVGVFMIPALSAFMGFCSMYAVTVFVLCFGRPGVVLAAGVLLVRMVFTLPCFFLMAEAAWPLSTELFRLSFGKERNGAQVRYESRYFLLFALCVVLLAAGVCCEQLLTPALFHVALGEVIQ